MQNRVAGFNRIIIGEQQIELPFQTSSFHSSSTARRLVRNYPPSNISHPCCSVPVLNSPRPLLNELVDDILVLLPVRVAVSLRRKSALRQLILNGRLPRQIQRALNRLDLDALAFFAETYPQWKATRLRWSCIGNDDLPPLKRPTDDDLEGEEGDGDEGALEVGVRLMPPVLVATVSGRWDAVRFLIKAVFSTKRAVDVATSSRAQIDDIRCLLSLGHDNIVTATSMSIVANRNEVPLVRLLHAYGLAIVNEWPIVAALQADPLLGDTAAANGHLSVVKLLHESAIPNMFSTRGMDAAAKHSLEVVRFLHESRSEGCTTEALYKPPWPGCSISSASFMNAALRAAPPIRSVQGSGPLHENRLEGCSPRAMDKAAASGRLKIVRFLHENRPEGCTTHAMDEAVKRWADSAKSKDGQRFKEVVLFLQENRPEGCTARAMDYASSVGRLDIVKFLHENRHEGCTTRAMDGACWVWATAADSMRKATVRVKASLKEELKRLQDVAFFLYRNRTEGCSGEAMNVACEVGCVKLVRFLLPIYPPIDCHQALSVALENNQT
ncbi:hypothetical protein BDK51DRAFT_46971 [Blyttiomyces helicus]|uniref:Uncharacterized protein n=1 Tax=Blyttiomyces helicus TaxID=388810 RepID=A0A4P9VX70_9FUNG|nr:hypothetical protein BDK51DRAFT_46971 [Blyttiomyces helicus]|eukprot:RKO84304.1 hypothetical protein BDK51DRAFT_46971 [Blyttiomyces helicus]